MIWCVALLAAAVAFEQPHVVPTAAGAWGTEADSYGFVDHWRQMGWDMGVDDYDDCGYVTEQVPQITNIEIKPGG